MTARLPLFTAEQIVKSVTAYFPFRKLDPLSFKEFPSYEGRNYYLRGTLETDARHETSNSSLSDQFVFKVLKISPLDHPRLHEEIAQIMLFLNEGGISCPKPVQSRTGKLCKVLAVSEITGDQSTQEKYNLSVLEFIEGDLLVNYTPKSPEVYYKLGQVLGEMNRIAMKWSSSMKAIQQRRLELWNLAFFPSHRNNLDLCQFSCETRQLIEKCIDEFESTIMPVIPELTSTILHTDYNDQNVLVSSQAHNIPHLSVIDFSDALYGPCVFDLGSSLYYTMVNKEDPLKDAMQVVRGYLSELRLPHSELKLLPCVVKARLIQSLVNSRMSTLANPENAEYLGVHAQYAEDLLRKLSVLPMEKLYE